MKLRMTPELRIRALNDAPVRRGGRHVVGAVFGALKFVVFHAL